MADSSDIRDAIAELSSSEPIDRIPARRGLASLRAADAEVKRLRARVALLEDILLQTRELVNLGIDKPHSTTCMLRNSKTE